MNKSKVLHYMNILRSILLLFISIIDMIAVFSNLENNMISMLAMIFLLLFGFSVPSAVESIRELIKYKRSNIKEHEDK